MIEFGIMLFFLLTLFLGMFEWCQIFIKHIRASTICREAAVAIHHDCKKAGASVNNCLVLVRNEMITKASRVFPEFDTRGEVIVKLFGEISGGVGGTAIFPSRYVQSDIDPTMLSTLKTVGVAELYYETKLTTGVERLFAFAFPRVIYKSTII